MRVGYTRAVPSPRPTAARAQCRERVADREPRDGHGLQEHAGDDQRSPPDMVGQGAGADLGHAPDRRVDGSQDRDLGERRAVRRVEERQQAPRHPVVEVVDEARLRGREQPPIPDRDAPKDGQEPGHRRRGVTRRSGLVAGVVAGLADKEHGCAEPKPGDGQAEQERLRPEAGLGCDEARDQGAGGDRAVPGRFVEAEGQAAPARTDEIDLHDHGRRPGQALVDAEQDVGGHDP